MLDGHRTLQIPTLDGEMVECEVNFSKNKKVKDCQVIRMRTKGVEFDIERDELTKLLLILGDQQTQKDLTPVHLSKIRKYETLLEFKFKASKAYNKGDEVEVTAPYIIEIPDVEELYSGNVTKLGKAPTKKL